MKKIKLSVLVLCLIIASHASASTFVRTGAQYELSKGEEIEGNFLAVGTPVSLSGSIEGDAVLLGNQITVTGYTSGDFLGFGILSRTAGIVDGDVRIVSGDATISGDIKGDLLVLAGSVDVLSSATIGGDVLLYAETAAISGDVKGDILGNVRNLTLDGAVGGNVDIATNQLILGSNASITESVRYTSNNLLSQAVDAVVGQKVLRNDPVSSSSEQPILSILMPTFMLLFATLLWFFLSKSTLKNVVTTTANDPVRSFTVGFVALVVVPFVVFVLSLSLVGMYVAALCIFGYITLLLLAVAAMPALIGCGCVRLLKLNSVTYKDLSLATILIGVLVCAVLFAIPSLGLYVLIILSLVTFGGLLQASFRFSRQE